MAPLAVRADRLAATAATSPYRTMLVLLGLTMALAASLALAAAWLFDDAAQPFRELAPLTWLSAALLAFTAVVAWAVHLRVASDRRERWRDFWSLSAAAFAIFTVVELTQPTIFLDALLGSLGIGAPAGFRDLDAFLLTGVLLVAGLILLRHAGALLAHPRAAALVAIGVLLGAGSQVLDSVLPATTAEFVAEETLKLAAEPFLLGGYLVCLREALIYSLARGYDLTDASNPRTSAAGSE